MSDYQKYINALRKCAKEHEGDKTFTGQIIVSNLCRDTADLLEKLEQEPRWISVNERLPEIHNYCGKYLVTLERGWVCTTRFTECDGKSWWAYDDVVAWMPLPKSYRGVEK